MSSVWAAWSAIWSADGDEDRGGDVAEGRSCDGGELACRAGIDVEAHRVADQGGAVHFAEQQDDDAGFGGESEDRREGGEDVGVVVDVEFGHGCSPFRNVMSAPVSAGVWGAGGVGLSTGRRGGLAGGGCAARERQRAR
jgi:hypothetical protein